METPNWRMGWGRMTTEVDAGEGRVVGSHLRVSGRVFDLALAVDEFVTPYEPPVRKMWATVGEPRLLVIGPYRMCVELAEASDASRGAPATDLTHEIEYALPRGSVARLLARVLAAPCARWCTTHMVRDACASFGGPIRP